MSMPDFNAQSSVVFGIVATAVVYLVARALSQFWRRKGCGAGCNDCPAEQSPEASGKASIVSREELAKSGQRMHKH